MKTTTIDLPILLPDVPDEHDACVKRLEVLLRGCPGVGQAHVRMNEAGKPVLCLHYDPDVVALAQVERLARTAGADVTERVGHVLLPIHLVAGEDAARRVEADLRRLDGVLSASVSLPAQVARVEFDRAKVSRDKIIVALDQVVRPGASPAPARLNDGWYARHKELVWSLIAGILLGTAWAGERGLGLPHSAALALYVASYGFGGLDLLGHTVKSLRKGRVHLDIDLLMLLAALGAAALGEWAEGAFLLFLFSFAHALEHFALDRARGAIRALADLAPPLARVLHDGIEAEIPVGEVKAGDIIVVRPAERIPVDGTIHSGRSAVDQAPITGESVPVEKEPGAEVFAGTINGQGALEIETTRAAGDRTLDRVIKLVSEAQTQKAPTQQFTERFESVFVPTVLVSDLLLIVVPPWLGLWDWHTSFYRGMALLVAASPCALALGTPAAVLAAIAQAARKGVLIKGGAHLENLGSLRAIAFDKTGTLTEGRPEVTDLAPAAGVAENELLRIAASVEKRSEHPLAQAVVRCAEAGRLELPEAGDLESVTARGVRSAVDGARVEIGTLRLWEAGEVPSEIREKVDELQAAGRSTMAVRHAGRWLGVIGVADRPRGGVRGVLQRLRGKGIGPLVMLTGDNRGVGEAIAKEVGLDEVRADLLPEDKLTAIQEMLAAHGLVAMVGDGVNDAPALAYATVGIAMGRAGTAVALETADVALMGDDLEKLPFAVGLSRAARGVIRQNLYISLGVIALLVLATTTGYIGIGPAVFAHEGSTLVVLGNALRLLAYHES
ncbi:heavy metal translocating P-type ATPase [Paludisphaera sp.]|uniref:heavy metal translocating P-type ATPase n=1 Tax=Paludisphaera sp. TaxID=2017432 RepID=UPI00301C9495